MSNQKISPEKITKPIQLLGAWLAGLIIVNGSFLGAAVSINTQGWAVEVLIIASVLNVPLFLICIFLLQTKYRPEMQEDSYYSKYLELSTGVVMIRKKEDVESDKIKETIEASNRLNVTLISNLEESIKAIAEQVKYISEPIGLTEQQKEDIKKLEKTIQNSEKSIALAKQMSKKNVDIWVNDLLENYQSVVSVLAESGLKVNSTFGSTSTDPEIPKKKMVGFGNSVPIEDLRILSKIAKRCGFNHIHFTERNNDERVVFGSYIYQSEELNQGVELTDDVYELIQDENSTLFDIVKVISGI
ncbi:hypothetical protein [Shewanella sp. SG41-3]|uniref:hypothetical protein n=1 Tax=Shewanella sp. SG41-3 TaxID=2760977 RepID=UPI0016037EE6|nr:hypothetical protein [Shewanella sp. SG41-3]MBB1477569.1 hypothetical protein [Shewanella sp. SG41-3]